VDEKDRGHRFLVRRDGRWHATTLLIVLVVLETTDLVFALDSIPAIFGVTRDPFIIYTSNVMAILGLRAMYFLLAAMMSQFRFLRHGLSLVLVFIGLRMLTDPWIEIPTVLMLLVVCGILAAAVAASLLFKPKPDGAA
jgi:tellurite resistance protein TerC